MYKIIERKNHREETIYFLMHDDCYHGKISQKNLDKFLLRGIAFDDSEGIEKYLKYNNL